MLDWTCPFSMMSWLIRVLVCCLTFDTIGTNAGKVTNPSNPPKNAILLSKVESLTLRDDRMTSGRRGAPVPQLHCDGPKEICGLYNVDVMRCVNQGSEYDKEDIQWACTASLPEEFKLGSTEVTCEGYASPDDPFILKGSCGVNYRLLLTSKGEERYRSQQSYGHFGEGAHDNTSSGEGTAIGRFLFMLIFLGVLFVIIKSMLDQCSRNQTRRTANRAGGYGGGGGGDDNSDDPPPPYTDSPQLPRGKTQASTRTTGGSSLNASMNYNSGWRPGPWTAAAAAGAAGYAAGRYTNSSSERTQREARPRPPTGTSARRDGTRASWGGGGMNASGYSGSSSGNSVHESTGFGGTSRR